MSIILNGKELAAQMKVSLAAEISDIKTRTGLVPGLAVIIVGDDPASKIYIRSKETTAKELGINSVVEQLNSSVSTDTILALIDKFNADKTINGILVQLPLPSSVDSKKVLRSILPEKDVDGFHPYNVGLMSIGDDGLFPCTPLGIMTLLNHYNIELTGKNAVVIGRSNIVGKPMAMMLTGADATVTLCHSKTRDLKDISRNADVIIAAIGRANYIKADFVKEGAVVVDVGINRIDNKLYGDVEFESVKDKVSYITPVPGGVGPMTIISLMQNTLKSFRMSQLR